ncbi:RICIN domain-containing protein [Streptosporangium sp. NPDC004631]
MRRIVSSLAVAALTLVGLAAVSAPAHADTFRPDQRIINRMDGSRLALYGDGVGEGAHAVSLRFPPWNYRTAKWTWIIKSDGYWVIKNEAADKCLQPIVGAPGANDIVIVKTCDGSALQDWSRAREDTAAGGETGWGRLRPRVNTSLALTLNIYQGSGVWNSLYLAQDQSSTDRLWRIVDSDAPW